MADSFDPFTTLIGTPRRPTRFGDVTDAEYEQRREQERAQAHARDMCRLCDADGYRGMVVCDHIDRSGAGARVRRAIRKQRLQVVR